MASRKTSSKAGSGSPLPGEPEYLVVGYLRRPHGVRGEMVMEVHTDFPERLGPDVEVFVGDTYQPLIISSARPHNEGMIVKFQNLDTPEGAGRFRNQSVYVRTADRPPLPAGQYYHHQLIGFSVVDEKHELLGALTEIMQTGANEVYVVRRPDNTEVLLPAISSVLLSVDMHRREILVHLLPGLIEDRGA